MPVRGIRGAIRATRNAREHIFDATRELLAEMQRSNGIKQKDVAAVIFTMSPDLNADYPAYAARELGWVNVPLLCARELNVPGGMTRVIRVLMLVNTRKTLKQIKHPYLGEAARLRPDLAKGRKKK